jgi:hypothetical protein|tara:strand:- start:8890 stop:9630 length:741 start_codon:yes stop_codon:yes gene_type:complete
MARISTYPIDTNLALTDKWIGSDANSNNATKNFTLESVRDWMNTTSSIDSQTLRYTYQANATNSSRKKGSISFVPVKVGDVPFSTITDWTLSSYSLKYLGETVPTDISGFYTTPLITSYIIITNAKDISKYGIFSWNSAALKSGTTDFWNIGLTHVVSSGSLENTKDYFISLLTYNATGSAGDKNFVFTQAASSAVWTVTHNLNKYCAVSVVDTAGTVVNGRVEYDSLNQVTITFSAAFSGQAFCN